MDGSSVTLKVFQRQRRKSRVKRKDFKGNTKSNLSKYSVIHLLIFIRVSTMCKILGIQPRTDEADKCYYNKMPYYRESSGCYRNVRQVHLTGLGSQRKLLEGGTFNPDLADG